MPPESADAALAAELADAAGRLLLDLRREHPAADPATLRALGDRSAQQLLATRLRQARPADRVLSEEAADDRTRLQADRVWIVDPLDGTREYAEGRHDWAVHVALWQRGGPMIDGARDGRLVAGAVALPALGELLATDPAPSPPAGRPGRHGRPRMAVSRTRPPELATRLAERLRLETVPMGSAGYKVAAVVRGEVDLYVHSGGQYEWDSAAPVAVAQAAGLHATRIDGSPLRYNQEDVLLPDLLVCRPDLAARVLAAIEEAA